MKTPTLNITNLVWSPERLFGYSGEKDFFCGLPEESLTSNQYIDVELNASKNLRRKYTNVETAGVLKIANTNNWKNKRRNRSLAYIPLRKLEDLSESVETLKD